MRKGFAFCIERPKRPDAVVKFRMSENLLRELLYRGQDKQPSMFRTGEEIHMFKSGAKLYKREPGRFAIMGYHYIGEDVNAALIELIDMLGRREIE